jgi:hypothetical protein
MNYFRNVFKYAPREKYYVPIISTIPDNGFNLSPCILFNGEKEVKIASKIEIITEYNHISKYHYITNSTLAHKPKPKYNLEPYYEENNRTFIDKIDDFIWNILDYWER